ncbi:MAG: nucleotidyl transferase AbiEii/AbiGii toxin family protein [Gammaproteobacteria bacterium]
MSEAVFKRPVHRQVLAILSRLDSAFLSEARCFFGGGTRIALELGEYRESRDMDFLC